MKNFKHTPMSLHADGNSKKVNEIGEKSQKDDEKDMKSFKNTPMSLHVDGNPKKVKKIGEKSQKDDDDDVALDVKNFKNMLMSLDADDESKKVKKFQDKSQNDDDDERLNHSGFDICPKKDSSVIKLKAPLHVMNRERRKQSMKGQNITVLRSGMVLMKGYISSADQISIVKTCRELGICDGGFYQPGYGSGTKLHLKMMCLGKNWDPETSIYSELRPYDNSKPPGIPEKFRNMVEKAIQDSNNYIRLNHGGSNEGKVVPNMSPDICIVNFYSKTGRLGLHQDKDESEESIKKGLPVVSFSIGDSAEFKYGENRAEDEAENVTLESGDVLIFGGKSRLIYHGVTSILPDTAPRSLLQATDMSPGRLNLTFRMY
ncbi:DNA N(6)-methyladenine demethylase ALKBH1C-like [Bidens hawaiensis]|uniref:DNA N(6)-methyladenine demethylase ALKBH1C-like n=1 Tax=Bidens hawaiensis TaxID=980011 RepID=UPI00404ADDCC